MQDFGMDLARRMQEKVVLDKFENVFEGRNKQNARKRHDNGGYGEILFQLLLLK